MCVMVQSIFVGFFTFQTMLLVIPEPIAKTYPSTWMATPDLLNGCIVMKDNGKDPTKIEEFTISLWLAMAPSSHSLQERLEGTEPHGNLDWTIAEEMQVGLGLGSQVHSRPLGSCFASFCHLISS